jgi:glutaredoxin 3
MPEIKVYTTTICPFCVAAKRLLKKKGAEFIEIDVSFDMAKREKMMELAGGARTVPQIFIGSLHVGGFDELNALEIDGKLDDLLAG